MKIRGNVKNILLLTVEIAMDKSRDNFNDFFFCFLFECRKNEIK